MKLTNSLASLAFAFCAFASFAQQSTPPSAQPAAPPAELPDAPVSNAPVVVQPTGPTAVFDTSMGRITCKLYAKETPETVANFVGLAEDIVGADQLHPAGDVGAVLLETRSQTVDHRLNIMLRGRLVGADRT